MPTSKPIGKRSLVLLLLRAVVVAGALSLATSTSAQDVAVDFGPPYGVWILTNQSTWTLLNGLSPEGMVTACGRG
jgi:hypothetical protein